MYKFQYTISNRVRYATLTWIYTHLKWQKGYQSVYTWMRAMTRAYAMSTDTCVTRSIENTFLSRVATSIFRQVTAFWMSRGTARNAYESTQSGARVCDAYVWTADQLRVDNFLSLHVLAPKSRLREGERYGLGKAVTAAARRSCLLCP